MGWKSGTKTKVLKDLSDKLNKKLTSKQSQFTNISKKAVLDFDVLESGLTAKKTFATLDIKRIKNKTIKIKTPKSVRNEQGVFYPIFPLLGLGTSRKYGARRFDKLAAQRILLSLGANPNPNLPPANTSFKK